MAQPTRRFNLQLLRDRISAQFRSLDPQNPQNWPALPRYALFLGVSLVVLVVLWFVWLSASADALDAQRSREQQLRDEYRGKLVKAVNLEVLKKQREQVLLNVTRIEKQLPSKAEMDALLSDINQAGLGRSLQFELFRPGQVVVKEYYAELPIALRLTGRYHDMGAFVADIAQLSRIVTLNNVALTQARDSDNLVMDATAKTFRYLDANEVAAQRKAAAKAGGKK